MERVDGWDTLLRGLAGALNAAGDDQGCLSSIGRAVVG